MENELNKRARFLQDNLIVVLRSYERGFKLSMIAFVNSEHFPFPPKSPVMYLPCRMVAKQASSMSPA